MDCRLYTHELLSAHADGELNGEERAVADSHLRTCVRCQAKFAEERRLKTLIRVNGPLEHVPADVRLCIRAALGEATDGESGVRGTAARPAAGYLARHTLRATSWITVSPRRAVLPFAALASILLIVAIGLGRHGARNSGISAPEAPPNPVFDLAAASFDGLARGFTPNVAEESSRSSGGAYYAWVVDRGSADSRFDEDEDLARAYHDAGVPEEIYDFTSAGYGLYGGRIDQSVDGWPMSYTLYRGEKGEILSICMHASDFAAPIGARYWAGTHSFFQYKDHSICLTFDSAGHFISILVSREPAVDLLRDVTLADASSQMS